MTEFWATEYTKLAAEKRSDLNHAYQAANAVMPGLPELNGIDLNALGAAKHVPTMFNAGFNKAKSRVGAPNGFRSALGPAYHAKAPASTIGAIGAGLKNVIGGLHV
jgi:hypothetical protein